MTIAVTGGNGEFGRAVLESLVVRTAEPIVGTVRDLAKVVPAPGSVRKIISWVPLTATTPSHVGAPLADLKWQTV